MSFIQRLVRIGDRLFPETDLQAAHDKLSGLQTERLTPKQLLIFMILGLMQKVPILWRTTKKAYNLLRMTRLNVYDEKRLHSETNGIYNQMELKLSTKRPRTVNILVPAFSISTISAGFFGVFQLALFIARQGYHVRLVMFDNFNFSLADFQKSLQNFSGLETLADEVEIEYIGNRHRPLLVSPNDYAVATVWYSAYLADSIRKFCNQDHFLYLIQDYESGFYPHNSLFALSDNTYQMPYKAFFSTKSLQDYFIKNGLIKGVEQKDYVHFNNACSTAQFTREDFMHRKKSRTRRLVFYSRPMVDRNMFQLGALALIRAAQEGIFDQTGHLWEFYGIGIGNADIYLNSCTKVSQLPRMTLKEYEQKMMDFDLCVTLMASPHPSLIPFDLAGSGALVVTNSFANKTQDYFKPISQNIFCAEPNLDALVAKIEQAVKYIDDLEYRYQGSQIHYPKNWQETWQPNHTAFLHEVLSEKSEVAPKSEASTIPFPPIKIVSASPPLKDAVGY